MGGSLTSGVSQDYSQLVVRGLSEFTPQLSRSSPTWR